MPGAEHQRNFFLREQQAACVAGGPGLWFEGKRWAARWRICWV